jgi:hypothetical protein
MDVVNRFDGILDRMVAEEQVAFQTTEEEDALRQQGLDVVVNSVRSITQLDNGCGQPDTRRQRR